MRRIFLHTGFFIAGLVAGIVFLEGFFQLIEFQLPYFELNEKRGKKMLPSKRITHFGEGFYMGATNQYGYLGTAYTPKKTPGKVRVAMIGDSYVEGFQVFDQYHFLRIAERKLNAGLPAPKYEILNFGVGNYNYNDMITTYMNYVKEFDPDILVFLLKYDDFFIQTDHVVPTPALKLVKDSVSIDYSFTNTDVFKTYKKYSWMFENSAVAYALTNAYKISKRKEEFRGMLFDKFYLGFHPSEQESVQMDPAFRVDERFYKSFAWLKGKRCIFVFRSDIPAGFTERAAEMNIQVANVDQALKKEFVPKNFDYTLWDITGQRGHWNFAAQDFVGNYMYNLISANQ